MADEVDLTSEHEQRFHSMQIKSIQAASKKRELPVIGKCHWCDEPFPEGDQRLFCDSECASDHHRFQKNKRVVYDD